MKALYTKGCTVFRTVWRASLAAFNVSFTAAKKETIWVLACALGSSVIVALASFVNAHVIQKASHIIGSNKSLFADGKNHGITEIFSYLSGSGLLALALTLALLAGMNYFVRLLRFIKTHNWSTKIKNEVDGRIRKHRTYLDVACLRGAEYESIKLRIQEQPFGWAAIEQLINIQVQFIGNFFNLLIFGTGLLFFNPIYAIVLFGSVCVRAVSEFYWGNKWWAFKDAESLYSRRRGVLATLFSNVIPLYELKFMGKAEVANEHIHRSQRAHLERAKKIVKGDAIASVLTEIVTSIVLAGVILHAVYAAMIKGDVALLVLTLDFSIRFISNLKEVLFDLSSGWKVTRSVAVITDEFFGLKPSLLQKGTKVPKFKTLHLKDVCFTYPASEKEALSGLTLSFPMGSKVALVGLSGGGKSTLASLINRQYDPTEGGIFLDNINLKSVHPQDWFNHCLCMGQDFAIPHVTVLEALCYGKWVIEGNSPNRYQYGINLGIHGVDMNEVNRACKRANFLEVVEALPNGFDSLIGTEQNGTELSKGQKQRLALAARFMAERAVMIYDEPDAALDNANKEAVIRGILDTESTVILVVHNLRACEHCDLVAYIHEGRVAEIGTHDELIVKDGMYAELYKKQVNCQACARRGKEKSERHLALVPN